MKVVDVNTSDPAHTSVVIEDPITGDQNRVVFSDAMTEEANRKHVFGALEARASASFRLRIREIEGDVVSIDILEVAPASDAVVEKDEATGGERTTH